MFSSYACDFFELEEEAPSDHSRHTVQAVIGIADARVRKMHVTGFHANGHVVFHEPLDSASALKVKFECPAQIRSADACARDACSGIHKRNPAGPRGKVVPQMWSQAHQPFGRGRELRSREQFQPPFEIASPPMVLAHSVAKHVAVGDTGQSQIVLLASVESLKTVSSARTYGNRLSAGAKPFSHAIFPNTFRAGFENRLRQRDIMGEERPLLGLRSHCKSKAEQAKPKSPPRALAPQYYWKLNGLENIDRHKEARFIAPAGQDEVLATELFDGHNCVSFHFVPTGNHNLGSHFGQCQSSGFANF